LILLFLSLRDLPGLASLRQGRVKFFSNVLYPQELSGPFLAIVFLPGLNLLGVPEEETRIERREALKPVKAPLEVEVVHF
jgi:hypothetical protein